MMRRFAGWMIAFGLLLWVGPAQAQEGVLRVTFEGNGAWLLAELLDDDLAHFELTITEPEGGPIATTPMVARTDYPGPSAVERISETELTTPEMRLVIDPASLCVTVSDRMRSPELVLSTFCPAIDEGEIKGFTFTPEGATDLYGLGAQFRRRGGTDGNWFGARRLMANSFGNGLVQFDGGRVANAQFPVLYALGQGLDNYALFVDHAYSQYWDLSNDPFVMQTTNAPLRWYVMTGRDLADLRADFMELTGRPPVPPRQMFGLWVSEYGYDNWAELESVLASMREADFPLDGFVLDVQWFGGAGGGRSQMGALAWDETAFPDPAAYIAALREEFGLGVMTIEEPYVAITSRGVNEAVEAGALVRDCEGCDPAVVQGWWGAGGMVDFTSAEAAAWWHDQRRQPLLDDGVVGHWTDLGEPESFNETAWYAGDAGTGHDHARVHNLYNLLWASSIAEGYGRNGAEQRPFILSRSGTAGIQRFGAALWSGDIASTLSSLAEQQNVQMHMAMSGVDYFGSDVGGFNRQVFDPVLGVDGLYTLWLANSALTDVPVRPHTANPQNAYATAPSLIGDVASNRANVRLRYALSPYLYTLAHEANRTGAAVFPPLVYAFQGDPAVRATGGQKMIGPGLMMAALTDYDPESTEVYLPAGGWFNFRTGDYIESTGETMSVAPSAEGLIEAPLFARDGAIIPLMLVDDQTLNGLGQRTDGSTDHTLILNVYHAAQDGAFTLIEDDGQTVAYLDGAVRETTITHAAEEDTLTVEIGAAAGAYSGAPDERPIIVRLYTPERVVGQVLLNGESLAAGEGEEAGWRILEDGSVEVRAGVQPADQPLTLIFAPEESAMQTPRPLLLAHFMPWYQTPDVSGVWGWHWTMNHFNPRQTDENGRPEIASQYIPLTGPYDSRDPAVLEYQVLLMKLAGIDGVIADWYGTSSHADYEQINAATGMLHEVVERAGLQFAVCYEDRTLLAMTNDGVLTTETAVQQASEDIHFAHEAWMVNESYVRFNDQPLLFNFGPVYLRQPADWMTAFEGLEPAPALVTLDGGLSFMALSSFPWPPMDMAGGATLNPAVLDSYLELFYRNARRSDTVIASAFPAFFDIYEEAGVRSSYGYLDPQHGETLRHTLDVALAQNPSILQLVTWNDYGEGTTIEPTEEYGYRYLEIIQDVRRQIDSSFTATAQDLRLPMRLLDLRRAHVGDAAINAQLDDVFTLIVGGDLAGARDTLDALEG